MLQLGFIDISFLLPEKYIYFLVAVSVVVNKQTRTEDHSNKNVILINHFFFLFTEIRDHIFFFLNLEFFNVFNKILKRR